MCKRIFMSHTSHFHGRVKLDTHISLQPLSAVEHASRLRQLYLKDV